MEIESEYRYQVGGALGSQNLTYVTRSADAELLAALEAGEICYILNSRQMGKSSLRVRTMQRLKEANYTCTAIDLTRLGNEEITAEQWYKGIFSELVRGFRLGKKCDRHWWKERKEYSPLQRLSQFVEEVLLANVKTEKIFIFLDEIDSILSLKFPVDDFWALIRSCCDRRAENPQYKRLNFALFGVATPGDLIQNTYRTSFNIGRAIALTGFTLVEAQPLAKGLETRTANPQETLAAILAWTGGQPFLTQKLCQLTVRLEQEIPTGEEKEAIAALVYHHILENWQAKDEPVHLRNIRDRLLQDEKETGHLLGFYHKILQEGAIALDGSREQQRLALSGVVCRDRDRLKIGNLIYQRIFDRQWVQRILGEMRPYTGEIAAWERSHYQDDSRLLRGQTLQEALIWAKEKNLPPEDYRFLNASQKLAKEEKEIRWEAERAKAIESRLRYQRFFLVAVSCAFGLSNLLGAIAFFQYRKSLQNELSALLVSTEALLNGNRQFDALVAAIRAKNRSLQLKWLQPSMHDRIDAMLQQAIDNVRETNRLSGHLDGVWGVAFSPDGQFIATGSRDKTVKLWQRNGKLVETLQGHEDLVYSVAFSPDGRFLASGSLDRTIAIWDLQTNALQNRFIAHESGVIGLAFSPDGRYMVSGSRDLTAKLWHADGTLARTLTGHLAPIVRVAFSPDGKLIATASDDKTARLWSLDGREIATFQGHEDEVYAVAFSPDGELIATVSDDKTARLWRQQGKQWETIRVLAGHADEVYGVAFSPDSQTLATGSRDQTVKLWHRDGRLLTTLSGHQGEIWQVAFDPEGQSLVSASSDGTVKLWQPQHPRSTLLSGHRATVWDVDIRADGKFVASVGGDNALKLWSQEGRLVREIWGHEGGVKGVKFSPDGGFLASTSLDNTLRLLRIDAIAGILSQKVLSGHEDATGPVTFSPDGRRLVSGSDDSTIKIWNREGELMKTLTEHRGSVRALDFHSDGEIFVSGSLDGTIKFWQRDGRLRRSLRGHDAGIAALAFSPDGKALLSGSRDRTLKLWTLEGKLLQIFRGHQKGVNDVAFSPDGEIIASAGDDGAIVLWNREGKQLTALRQHKQGVNSIAFSRDGKILVSGSTDNQVILWHLEEILDFERLLEKSCDWVRDYLQNNVETDAQDAKLCEF
ncbi:MAG: AAA-like domain-containing protein [Cyanobacteria bacterium SBLK]|nr:AAA-like domain-containing protein [Cyanobacteria bacterium SBLK]